MVCCIPDQVQQRVADLIENGPVELDFPTFHVEADSLPQLTGEIAHESGKALEHLSHRRHPGGEDFALHGGHQPRDAATQLQQRGVARFRGERGEPVLGDDKLTHLLHECIEPAQLDPNLAAGAPA